MPESFGQNGLLTIVIYFAFFIAVFYFLIIRPRKKQEKQHVDMVNELKRGDKIVTIGGMKGEITKVKEDAIVLRVSENTEIEFIKKAVGYKVTE